MGSIVRSRAPATRLPRDKGAEALGRRNREGARGSEEFNYLKITNTMVREDRQ